MSKLISINNEDGSVSLMKSYEGLADENKELAKKLDYITKEEIIKAIKKIASAAEVEVKFTYDKLKNKV